MRKKGNRMLTIVLTSYRNRVSTMDEFFAKAGSQVVSFAIKSGISLASSYAIKRISNFVVQIPHEDAWKIDVLRAKLEDRIDIISNSIDLVRLVAARGNTNLQSTLKLTKSLKEDIDTFDERIEELLEGVTGTTDTKRQGKAIKDVEGYINDLLKRIEEITPFINLSLTTSGANLSSALSKQISPGLLLQASNHVIKSNELFSLQDAAAERVQVGPVFEVTLFSIFYNANSENRVIWKEDMKKAHVTVERLKGGIEVFDYFLNIKQSFDDERYHNTEDGEEEPLELSVPIGSILKIFFSVSGKLLKLEESDQPVLVLKTSDDSIDGKGSVKSNISSTPAKWYAFGAYEKTEVPTSSDDEEEDEDEDEEEEEEEEEEKEKKKKQLETNP
ncbi:Yrb30p KNAG_0E03470 [Huiozyma naganishii CBS 8797]|uniref:Ran-specific GTPase-activating protein 30 n=1 Tax=Huiozyma naganishii (strain ATCC MYA-139 / BCRC 22969 / CBS 8797 / KCTC 17520 / NBRC 10181 / NCYC 3082 / Yp74L-3) TaxID=1071383 RepID=J7S6V5_HUIN7|nr:hypothetical protein KNAG_0E03470 [Kazachstania naganishii CBS 8797]CCK70604.1 hypothetical protein KNAG_0E03470 [Kazachstania naganishii CBS 8797]